MLDYITYYVLTRSPSSSVCRSEAQPSGRADRAGRLATPRVLAKKRSDVAQSGACEFRAEGLGFRAGWHAAGACKKAVRPLADASTIGDRKTALH